MNNLKISTLLLVMLIIPSLAFTQIKFGIHANYGISNFIEKNNEPSVIVGNYYTSLPSYSFGFEALYSFSDSKFGFKSGLSFSSFASENHMPDDFNAPNYTGPRSWDEKFNSMSIPLKLNYQFEKWVHINAGVANTIHLIKPKDITTNKINDYTLSFIGGIDFIIKKRVIIGAMYYRDIRPTMLLLQAPPQPETYNVKYSIEQITFKIGYIIKS
ncbi:MAG: outer membrane beta-barrel protein [Bacteroidota bacterium]|nr:outer membrane beta-barrel protein [Bacteroidota bacterium]